MLKAKRGDHHHRLCLLSISSLILMILAPLLLFFLSFPFFLLIGDADSGFAVSYLGNGMCLLVKICLIRNEEGGARCGNDRDDRFEGVDQGNTVVISQQGYSDWSDGWGDEPG